VHRLSADNRYWQIIGQFADNRYWPFDNRHWPIIGMGHGQLFVLVSKTTKNGHKLFILHRLLNTGMGWAGP